MNEGVGPGHHGIPEGGGGRAATSHGIGQVNRTQGGAVAGLHCGGHAGNEVGYIKIWSGRRAVVFPVQVPLEVGTIRA